MAEIVEKRIKGLIPELSWEEACRVENILRIQPELSIFQANDVRVIQKQLAEYKTTWEAV